jgi:hypothetical protein
VTELEAVEAIKAMFVAAWDAQLPGIPLALENEIMPTADTFGMLTIQHTGGAQRTTGGRGIRRVERTGYLNVKLWTPAGVGTSRSPDEIVAGVAPRLTELSAIVRGILEMVDIDAPSGGESITTQAAIPPVTSTDGRWAMGLVRVPFTYAETK